MEINEKLLKNIGLCLFLGILSFVIIAFEIEEHYLSIIVSSLIVGFLSTGLGIFEKYDESITAAIYEFIVIFVSLNWFVPLSSLFQVEILECACEGAIVAAVISFIKIYYLNKENPSINTSNNLKHETTNNKETENIQFTNCPKCDAMIKIDSIFCESCGSKIDTIVKDTVCMNCGSKLDKDSLFCENCGTKKQL